MTQHLYIDRAWVETERTFAVTDPWDGTHLGDVAVAEPRHVADAIAAARRALAGPALPAHERSAILRRAAVLLRERAEEFAQSLRAEAGKPIGAARGEVARAVDTLDLSAEEARRGSGTTVPMDAVASGERMLAFEIAEPVGVVAAITPFNFPLNLALHKLGPAIAAGCPVVWKPSEKTPLTAGLVVGLLHDAGLPAGALNMVTGDPKMIVASLLEAPEVQVVTFTGSSAVGWDLKQRSPRKRHLLELGSNAAVYIAADADLGRAVAEIAPSAFGFSGQACISVQRVYVAEEVADDFLTRLKEATLALVTGDPNDERTVVGPLITREARDRVVAWVREAVVAGASVIAGGTVEDGLLLPTVLSDVPAECSVICDEVFGPVVSVNRVAGLDAALDQVNSSRYGLNTAIFTSDVNVALAFARKAEAGAVMINVSPSYRADHMPYGGVKESGQGREGIPYAVRELTEQKLVVIGA